MKLKLLLACVCVLSYCRIAAQSDTLELRDFYMDLSTPSISAFSILDIEPGVINRPGTVKEFALGMTNFVNAKGDLKAGLAMEWAPFYTFNRKTGNWENKTGNDNKFEWKNWTISAATTNDSTNVKLAGAIRFSPIDGTNPMNDKDFVDSMGSFFFSIVDARRIQQEPLDKAKREFMTRVNIRFFEYGLVSPAFEELADVIDITSSSRLTALKLKYDTLDGFHDRLSIAEDLLVELKKEFSENALDTVYNKHKKELEQFCIQFANLFYRDQLNADFSSTFSTHILLMKENYKKANWNKFAMQVSAGWLFNSESGTLKDLSNNYFVGAFNTGFPMIGKTWFKGSRFNTYMRSHSQVIVQVKWQPYYSTDTLNLNSFFAGARFLLGNYDKRFSCELAYINQYNNLDIAQSGFRYSVGAEVRLMENFWLELAVGGQTFEDKTGVNILPRFAFRHAFGNENRFFKK